MAELVSFSSIDDFSEVARSYSRLLAREDNRDIKVDFPETFHRYSGDPEIVRRELEETANACASGQREQFVVFNEGAVVGLSAVQRIQGPPVNLPEGIPNVSEFILRPFRGKGLGEASLRACLELVDESFGGHAYTRVRTENIVSRNMVEKVGFASITSDEKFIWYTYER